MARECAILKQAVSETLSDRLDGLRKRARALRLMEESVSLDISAAVIAMNFSL
jgi:hypothetical protein